MNAPDRNAVVLQKIKDMKNSYFKATAIKFELEAHLNRRHGDGNQNCSNCDGDGGYEDEDGDWYDCETCSGEGVVSTSFGDDRYCHDWLLERLVPLGLAEASEGGWNGLSRNYRPTGALVYSKFYNDGSVDSEWTFTLSIEDPEIVFKVPEIIKLFTSLGDAVGNGFNVDRAGMHTAIINSEGGRYPVSISTEDTSRFFNFKKSMTMLLPALFFLATDNEGSRDLQFRLPRVAGDGLTHYSNNKYSAISYRGGALEYRVFNVCYDNPDTILDNLVVIANTLRYWTLEYRPSGLSKITPSTMFGPQDNGDRTLKRLYSTSTHIELLNAGLRKLKPSYYTVTELKKQRNFSLNRRSFDNVLKLHKAKGEEEYKTYVVKHKWETYVTRRRVEAEYVENYIYRRRSGDELPELDPDNLPQEVANDIDRYMAQRSNPRPLQEFVDQYVANLQSELSGRHELVEA